jgi:hypothetical protein
VNEGANGKLVLEINFAEIPIVPALFWANCGKFPTFLGKLRKIPRNFPREKKTKNTGERCGSFHGDVFKFLNPSMAESLLPRSIHQLPKYQVSCNFEIPDTDIHSVN